MKKMGGDKRKNDLMKARNPRKQKRGGRTSDSRYSKINQERKKWKLSTKS